MAVMVSLVLSLKESVVAAKVFVLIVELAAKYTKVLDLVRFLFCILCSRLRSTFKVQKLYLAFLSYTPSPSQQLICIQSKDEAFRELRR